MYNIKYKIYWEIIKFQKSSQQVGNYRFLNVVKLSAEETRKTWVALQTQR